MTTKENLERWAEQLARQNTALANLEATLHALGNVELQIPNEALAEIDAAARVTMNDLAPLTTNHPSIRL